ncbi:MAG: hypothetical protein JXB85_06600 [Anaerolineales bacterium]|nr:hypothetical protein [Anaerolineales bacterium]
MTKVYRRGFTIATFFVLTCTLLPGCNLPDPVTEVRYPYCLLMSDLVPPAPTFPIDYIITDDLTPAFEWGYPLDCRPASYQIEVAHYSDCDSWGSVEGALISETTGAGMEWSPAEELEPRTFYQWRVAGIIRGTVGEYSEVNCFWTGPTCDATDLIAPIPAGPEEGALVTTEYVILSWTYPDPCLPEGFQPELSDDPAFAGPNLMSVHSVAEVHPAFGQISEAALDDCTRYYWRVTARVGTNWGPTSVTQTFTTDFHGSCGGSPTPPEPMPSDPPVDPGPPPTDPPPAPAPADTTPPPAPAPASPSGDLGCVAQVTLTWSPVTDPSGISQYQVVLEAHSGDQQWQPVGTLTGLTGTSTSVNVQCGWYYRWSVLAIDGAGNAGPASGWVEFAVLLQ